jgi:hypothetical protein
MSIDSGPALILVGSSCEACTWPTRAMRGRVPSRLDRVPVGVLVERGDYLDRVESPTAPEAETSTQSTGTGKSGSTPATPTPATRPAARQPWTMKTAPWRSRPTDAADVETDCSVDQGMRREARLPDPRAASSWRTSTDESLKWHC